MFKLVRINDEYFQMNRELCVKHRVPVVHGVTSKNFKFIRAFSVKTPDLTRVPQSCGFLRSRINIDRVKIGFTFDYSLDPRKDTVKGRKYKYSRQYSNIRISLEEINTSSHVQCLFVIK